MTVDAASGQTVPLLDYDPELGRGLSSDRFEQARTEAVVTTLELGRGSWDLGALADRCPYGLLVLDGLLSREVGLEETTAMQLFGRGDLVHPRADATEGLVATDVRWQVLEPAVVALLDERFLASVRAWPEIVAALFGRLSEHVVRLGTQRALCQLPRVEDRIHALLWFLAERWGRVTPHGVIVPLRLTHDALGRLVGAKRPTVSLAIKALEARGSVYRRADGAWLLGDPPPAPPVAAGEAVGSAPVTFVDDEPAFAERPIVAASGTVPVGGDQSGQAPDPLAGLPLLHRRIDRMRHVHARARSDVRAALERSAAARTRSAALRARLRGDEPPGGAA